MVVMVVVMMVMRVAANAGAGEHQDKEHSSKNLLHGVNLARCRLWKHLTKGTMYQVRKRLVPRCGDLA